MKEDKDSCCFTRNIFYIVESQLALIPFLPPDRELAQLHVEWLRDATSGSITSSLTWKGRALCDGSEPLGHTLAFLTCFLNISSCPEHAQLNKP